MAERPSDEPNPDSGSISDEVWDKFVQDTERDIHASAPKEPSARARVVTERLRQQDARGEVPDGWRTGPAWREMDGRAARRRRLWAILGVPLAIAAVVVANKPSLLLGDDPGSGTGVPEAVAASQLPAETAAPTAAPSEVAPVTPTLERPFAGSPAARWADGAAGIVLPKATAVGSFSKAQVEKALRQTKELLVDANLDPATLRGERPETALGVIDPLQTGVVDLLETALRKPDEKHDPLWMFSRYDPAELRLAGDVVKTRGRMTFEAGESASFVIHADYTFVYPLARTDGSTEVARTVIRRVLDLEVSDPVKYQVTPGKLFVTRYDQEIGNSACDVYDGYFHPQFSTGEQEGELPTGPTLDPYDRSEGIDQNPAAGCGVASRT
ncbi:hypothetical protein [Streptomyces sp. NBC_00038]|uniref:hypothetical protein n=1 Tax=Streptomyces sp. NBC_00038 TaxID=2903615 RepID=UPI002252809C|nr:hypothetical protein [Streptomyces sp. NBC_00038]MCX5560111.1 hypothetical protein [Streptomyces sp. NBC_00038]